MTKGIVVPGSTKPKVKTLGNPEAESPLNNTP